MDKNKNDNADQIKVLLVDDEVGFVDVLARRLLKRGIQVTAALNGTQAIQSLRKQDFDVVIKNGRIFDGSGGEAFEGDIGINGDVIGEIGLIPASRSRMVIEAKDRAVCPGFIDAHDHTNMHLLVNPKAESLIRQGITTCVSGNCGLSPFPMAEAVYEEQKEIVNKIKKLAVT